MEARTKEEKLQALIEFLSAVPKHKGTEKLVMQVRRQIARLREEIEREKARKRSGGGSSFFVEKEGDVQLVLLGLPNSGKSTLFSALTGLETACSETPFETEKPQPGMMEWGGLQVQVVDTPSLVPSESSPRNSQILALASNADALAIVVDAAQDPVAQLAFVERLLRARGVTLREEEKRVTIERRSSGGISVLGGRLNPSEVAALLRDYGIYHALVRLSDDATLDDVEAAVLELTAYKPAVVIVTKTEGVLGITSEVAGAACGLKVLEFGFEKGAALKEELGKFLLERLNLIRIYTRNPKSGEVSEKPLVIRRGARVEDVARIIHSRLYKEFKYALIWNERRLKFSPVKVGRDFLLDDMDVVEIVA